LAQPGTAIVTDKIDHGIERDFPNLSQKRIEVYPRRKKPLRSELIFMAVTRESNRYMLVRLAAKATRILHWPHTRIQDTMNDALRQLARCSSGIVTDIQQS
jgi:hypothetical protein